MRRPVSCPSQARLLHNRGDLRGTRTSFNVHLTKPSPIVRPGELHCKAEANFARGGCARTGLELKRAKSGSRLVITEIDRDWRRKTPAARWNAKEEQQAHRGDSEYVSLAVRPGDRIKSVNDFGNATGMLSELQNAGSYTMPRKISLQVSRDISDVLAPLECPPEPEQSQPHRVPAKAAESPNMMFDNITAGDTKRPWASDGFGCPARTKPPRPPVDNNIMKLSPPRPPVDNDIMKLAPPRCLRPWSGDEASTRSPSLSSRSPSVSRSTSNGPGFRKTRTSASSPVLTQAGLVASHK
jgi:hypothetical protein